MKKAYQTYAQHAHAADEKNVHILMERAELYGVDFLRNQVLLQAMMQEIHVSEIEEEDLKKVLSLWKWLHNVQEKAQMS